MSEYIQGLAKNADVGGHENSTHEETTNHPAYRNYPDYPEPEAELPGWLNEHGMTPISFGPV